MNYKLIFGIISTISAIFCFFPYLKDIFAKKTTPHIYSWLIWSILQVTGVTAMIIGGAGFGFWGLGVGTLISITVFILSFKYGTKNITKYDTYCLILAFISIAIWFIQKDPFVSVILISITDFIGFIPTYRKGYEDPRSETMSLYLLSAISNIFALLAMQQYSIVTSFYVASLVITNSIFVVILLLRRKQF